MAVAYFSTSSHAASDAAAILLISAILSTFTLWVLTVLVLKFLDGWDFARVQNGISDFCVTVHLFLHAAVCSLRGAVRRSASFFVRRGSTLEDYELGGRISLSQNPAPLHGPVAELDPVHSHGSVTDAGDTATGRPNSPTDPACSTSSLEQKDSTTVSSETPPGLDANSFPWASFVAPWDLIAATSSPRASSVLEAATGHSEDHGSVDRDCAQI